MISSRFYLCAIPRLVWEQPDNLQRVDIVHFVDDALGCERRIAKEINLENEFNRYTLTCQRLEQEIIYSRRIRQANNIQEFRQILQAEYFPAQALHPGYLALLSRTESAAGWERLGASFFPPDKISQHRHAFGLWVAREGLADTPVVQQRLTFLEWAEEANCGVVELQTGFHVVTQEQHEAIARYNYTAPTDEGKDSFVEIPDFETTGVAIEFFGETGRKQHLAKILRKQIHEALVADEPVTFGNQAPHDVITQVLHEFVFVSPEMSKQPAKMRVAYADGSEAELFPLFCLPRTIEAIPEIANPLRVALLSMRHLELDPEIDFCWFRNREVSRTRTLAETDQFCFDTTLTQIDDCLKLGDLGIHLYHTGFEPAVLGFYRGIVYKLLELQKQQTARLSVEPFYFRGGDNYQAGTIWC
jgi:hypothetical protein